MRLDEEMAAYAGLDWGDQQHAVQLQPAGGGPVEQIDLAQRPDVLHAWVAELRRRFDGRPVGIAIEQRRGAVVHALMQYEFLVLYPVNPKALARYREAFHPSGAKDDPTDAALLLDLVQTHRAQLRPWRPETVAARKLQLLCEQRRKLVQHRVALTNRLTSLLKQYFPQALDWVGTLDSRQGCDFLRKWPTLAAVQRARPTTMRRFYQQHNCRRAAVIDDRLAQIATAQPLTTDPAIVDTLSLAVQTYATQLRTLLDAIRTFDAAIATVFADHPDHDLFVSLPGAGPVCAPRLAAAFGTDRTRWQAASALQTHAGIAPGHRTQRQDLLGASPLRLSEVPEADVSRIRRSIHPLLDLGPALLRPTARTGQQPPRRPPREGLQMDPDSLSVLAGSDTLRRGHLPRRAPPERLATRQGFRLTEQLRCPCRLRRSWR